uniref:HK97 family phage portal protein n=1 Tax=uncultured bacterium Contig643 TaxID=1393602 RepID=W0FHB3_9BACT|nr:HK97 family phage portal protein [uncultured bacterium Contig643]
MGMWANFLEWLFPVTDNSKAAVGSQEPIIINIPAEIYYKELAIYAGTSLISNGISRSEIKTFRAGKAVKEEDYFRLNMSPNANETSSWFWHKVINKMIRHGEALIVETKDGKLYCADSFCRKEERPIAGDIYDNVVTGNLTFDRIFSQNDTYLVRLDNINVRRLIDGMYEEYGPILTSAAKKLKQSGGNKYKLHIEGVKAGDKEFNKEFEDYIQKQLKTFMEADSAVYPEFDGYSLEEDPAAKNGTQSSKDYIELQNQLSKMVAGALHIPESMMTGNITSMKDVIGAFLTFGVDPYADAITEALNKGAGYNNFKQGNYYKVDTSKIQHHDIFELATACMNIISSGVMCIDEVREDLDRPTLNTDWSKKHFITKNFEEMEKFLKSAEEGGQ